MVAVTAGEKSSVVGNIVKTPIIFDSKLRFER